MFFDDEYQEDYEKYDEKDYEPMYEKYSYHDDEYNDDYGFSSKKKSKSFYDLNNDDEDEEENEEPLEKNVDDDLAGYFADARMFSSKKKLVDTMKKKPKKIVYKADDKVTVTANKTVSNGTIVFGPYEVNKKQMYQVELDNGDLIEMHDKHIKYQES